MSRCVIDELERRCLLSQVLQLTPEITVVGRNGIFINNGDSTPNIGDGTFFGSVPQFSSPPVNSFTVFNDGNAVLTVGPVGISGTGFRLVDAPGLPINLLPSQGMSFGVQFDTSLGGTRLGQVNIVNTDFGENPFSFTVAGRTLGAGAPVLGVFREGRFILDSNQSGTFSSDDTRVSFGLPRDIPIVGDWNGIDGDDIGIFRDGLFILDSNGSGQFDFGDERFFYGRFGDTPVIGDWDGDGKDDVGVFRPVGNLGQFILDTTGALLGNGNRQFNQGDTISFFGFASDIPVAGKFRGAANDQIGVYRNGQFFLDTRPDFAFDDRDRIVRFGLPGDRPVIGDWNNDGVDEVGVFRDGEYFLDSDNDGDFDGFDDRIFYGLTGDTPLVLRTTNPILV